MNLSARQLLPIVLALVVGGVVIRQCTRTLVECGHDGPGIPSELIDAIKNVPEFHDCQRFIQVDGRERSYGGVYAIYASASLGSLGRVLGEPVPEPIATETDTSTQVVATTSGAGGLSTSLTFPAQPGLTFTVNHRVVAVGLIVASEDYGRLGIKRGLNCLYVGRYRPTNLGQPIWFARLLTQVPNKEASCAATGVRDLDADRTVPLKVVRDPTEEFRRPSDFPMVARWDWDEASTQQYVGVACEDAWCEIGAADFTPSPLLDVSMFPDSADRRVRRIKGWYDQQFLAKARPDGTLEPSRVLGTIIADPRLGQQGAAEFEADYVKVASVLLTTPIGDDDETLQQYRTKYNFVAGEQKTVDGSRELRISGKAGDTKWRGRIPTPGSPPEPPSALGDAGETLHMHKDVTFRPVSNKFKDGSYRVPGVARWRWLKKDEGTWTRCTEGCCEMAQ